MLFFNLFYQFRRHTAHNCILRNIPCHNCPGCDHSTVSYADALCNDRSRSDPDPVADPDRGITVVPVIGIQVMINSRKDNIVADQCVITDIYSTLILQKSESGVRLCLVSRRLFLKATSRAALSRSNVKASYTSIPASYSFVPGCIPAICPVRQYFQISLHPVQHPVQAEIAALVNSQLSVHIKPDRWNRKDAHLRGKLLVIF